MARPDDRTKRYYLKRGYLCDKVERSNGRFSHDFAGFVDLIATRAAPKFPHMHLLQTEVIGIQATDKTSVSKRIKKIMEHENYEKLKHAGWRIVVHGWDPKVRGEAGLKEVEL